MHVVSKNQKDLNWLPASCLLQAHSAAPAFSLYFTCTLNNLLDLERFNARLQYSLLNSLIGELHNSKSFFYFAALAERNQKTGFAKEQIFV